MANLKVIVNSAYRNYSTHQREHTHEKQRLYEIREDEGNYDSSTGGILETMKSLLDLPLWPQFTDGAFLSTEEAIRLYRLAHGAQGLIHILNRSGHADGCANDYEGERGIQLTDYQQSQLWAGLIELGKGLVALVDDVHEAQR